ncbi:hypothetical protein [Halogeometricum sp. CBA1124]|uniref:hypothetical protein n=1 Tax=Halogeometricum sp. CBA1124 TaxID=2668071 RepID=UPI00142A5BBC|nr:hypothetical protein [Halogeometricum sp. CBA1124]MUV58497.1 hypothetical protein [Halogeometricum sp. CBA1124]
MSDDSPLTDRFWLVLTAALLVVMPALTLLVAYVALAATRSVIIEQITLVEAVELYLVELVAFTAFSYLLYRVTMYTVNRQKGSTGESADPAVKPSERTEGEADSR